MWVRDSIAGIGTMTFIDPETGAFAGLGHPVCDTDTGGIIPIQSGEAVPVEITGTRRGVTGKPGELRGRFTRSPFFGVLDRNCESGIYGRLSESALSELSDGAEEYRLGYRQEITTGAAEIYATTDGSVPRKYSAEIESVDYSGSEATKNMVIHITDPDLLRETGGIVQGMSGSPIVQNDRLIGAVTHVFVSDPTRGYAIFAENMLVADEIPQ
jgi:stage IV sporulation protein B